MTSSQAFVLQVHSSLSSLHTLRHCADTVPCPMSNYLDYLILLRMLYSLFTDVRHISVPFINSILHLDIIFFSIEIWSSFSNVRE